MGTEGGGTDGPKIPMGRNSGNRGVGMGPTRTLCEMSTDLSWGHNLEE